jgi:hypothetical protein
MSEQVIWFQNLNGDEPPSLWHAAEIAKRHADDAGDLPPFYCRAYCGYETGTAFESYPLDVGNVPVTPHSFGVCLHCQRALEMERRDDE